MRVVRQHKVFVADLPSFLQSVRRPSLEPPSTEPVSWEEYIQSDPGKPPPLGRTLICKESSKSFKATVAMVSSVNLVLLKVSLALDEQSAC